MAFHHNHIHIPTTKTALATSLCIIQHRFSLMQIEVDISKGLFQFNIAGIPDKTIKESRFRILSALKNTQFKTPSKNNEKVTISLFPIDIHKKAIYTDLAITFAYLKASKQIVLPESLSEIKICCIGNITLSGNIQVDQTDISHLIYQGYLLGIQYFIIPQTCTIAFDDITFDTELYICTIESLLDLMGGLQFKKVENKNKGIGKNIICKSDEQRTFTIDTLEGLHAQKRALQIAIAGDHHILFIGPPGAGKSALAQAAIELMDNLTSEERLRLTSQKHIFGVMYSDKKSEPRSINQSAERPVEVPHYKVTPYQLSGNNLRPSGILQSAYHGLLILDELAEYNRQSIETLRHRLDMHTSKEGGLIIATSNLCPCGKTSQKNSTLFEALCTCTKTQIKKYMSKISEPIRDRFHIICHIEYSDHVTNTEQNLLGTPISGKQMSQKIRISRSIQRQRNKNRYNAILSVYEIKSFGIEIAAEQIIQDLSQRFTISKRKTEHIYKIARTIADLESKQKIESRHVYEALQYTRQSLD
ncbi:MAG: hypothetical protein RIQ72_611 [Candidatus Parcubacteria bacterium]